MKQRSLTIVQLSRLMCGLVAATTLQSAFAGDASVKQAANRGGGRVELVLADGQTAQVGTNEIRSGHAVVADVNGRTVSCALQPGDTTLIVSYPDTALLDRFTFINENAGAEGELSIAVSNNSLPASSEKWTPVDGDVPFTGKRAVNVSMLGVEARCVRLSFHVRKGGRLAANLPSGEDAAATGVIRVTNRGAASARDNTVAFDFASLRARARVVYVSSGSLSAAKRVLDDNRKTRFQFAPDDRNPTIVIELAERETLDCVMAMFEAQRGRLDVYLLDDFRDSANQLMSLPPVASTVDRDGTGDVTVDFDPHDARFVALQWTPFDPPSQHDGYVVSGVSAFGNVPIADVSLQGAPDLFAENPNLPPITGEAGVDLSNNLGTLGIPPQVAPVSP